MNEPKYGVVQSCLPLERESYPEMEGDYTVKDYGRGIHIPQDESDIPCYPTVEDHAAAFAEADYHFTLMAFESLLHKHGLAYLLKDMSEDSAWELLQQAHTCTTKR